MTYSVTRRSVLAGAAAVGVVGTTAALAACGSSSDDSSGGSDSPVTLAASSVPVGGGTITGRVVVTQPVAGTFKAFSAVCTHQGCIVSSVDANAINCGCHNSAFSIKDGSVLSGPALSALPAKKVTDSGGTLTVS